MMLCPRSLILDRVLKSAVTFPYRKFSMSQISQQGKVPDMAEVRNRLREIVGGSTNWQYVPNIMQINWRSLKCTLNDVLSP
ncbi:uncharacterized protein LOC113073228 isoform X1 [Carassius auratus]|uniref:Uncharacterized protein LOC113073228 isoform X1 n=1 Tax=Carassius auratus TaxID=7957 RepID=A0A6P6N056_CARAU|nr:uncharacterized protein LOC113073228 isoform X1 [Carassius auratus]